jgi:hypothetical protein
MGIITVCEDGTVAAANVNAENTLIFIKILNSLSATLLNSMENTNKKEQVVEKSHE